MRINTPCFEGFVNMLHNKYGLPITDEEYISDSNGFVTEWLDDNFISISETYEQAWNDAAAVYNGFGR